MKLKNKKMLAFLLAIVMIFTFANFSTFSAFANDDEPIENTETASEDNTASDAEEQQVEELVSEIPELVSEPSSPDDPTENGSLGDISSGEINSSQIVAPDSISTYPYIAVNTGISGYLPDGVYSLENIGNDNYWASILENNSDAGAHVVQTQSSTNPFNSFNRAFLFKISRVPNTDRYVIRSMLNNRLGLYFQNSMVKLKEIPYVDANVSTSDTFQITVNGGGFIIKQYGTENVIAALNSTASGTSKAKLYKTTVDKAGDRCRWTFYRYTGDPLLGIPLDFSPNDWSYGATLNTEYTVELKPWSTTIGANTPYVVLHPDSVGAATTTRIYDHTITVTPTKVGPITIRAQIYFDGTTTTHTSYRCDFITVPDFGDDFAYIENKQTKRFVEIEDSSTSSGAIIQQWSFHGSNNSRWTFELEWWGYFSIKSVYSNLRMGVDPSNTSVIKQTTEQTTYTDWMFTETSNGNYTIKNKAVSDKVLAVPQVPPEHSGDGYDLTLVTYTDDDSDYYDEWDIEIPLPLSGSEIPYNPSIWNNSTVMSGVNCYAYALNNQTYPNSNNLWYMNPGDSTGDIYWQHEITEELILYETSMDAINFGFEFNGIGKYATCSSGSYKVALVIDTGNDYHWYRQNSDGSWSHKRGQTAVINYDASGEVIFDPENADRYYPNVANYTVFVGFFEVTPLNNMYDFSQ